MVRILLDRAELSRRKTAKAIAEASVITRGCLTLNIPQAKAYIGGRDAGLTPKEFALLLMLMRNEGIELSCETLYGGVWDAPMNDDSAVIRTHISLLKKKLDADNADDFAIHALYGGGYIFTTE